MRRLNNREFKNSIRDALGIEDVGTHEPTANLLGDPLHEGFDTHGETLGFSHYHLEQYISATREILNATLQVDLARNQQSMKSRRIRSSRSIQARIQNVLKGVDWRTILTFSIHNNWPTVNRSRRSLKTGWYTITIRCKAKDLGRYDSDSTGIYDGDPVVLKVLMGDSEPPRTLFGMNKNPQLK